jgi:hypothetical protein
MKEQKIDDAYETWLSKHGGYANSMTMRDYFAAKAMQGMLAENGGGAVTNDEVAEWAYHLADAMLKARNK